jgi:hypothetical protein
VRVPCSTVFRLRVCHFPPCGAVFYLCCHCDRGQRYCSLRCRQKSRRRQRREANRRHQHSPEGRLDHRDRQRTYRQRRRAPVTDPSSLRSPSGANLIAPEAPTPAEAASAPEFFPWPDAKPETGWVVCQICQRRGRWINPFPEVKHDFP